MSHIAENPAHQAGIFGGVNTVAQAGELFSRLSVLRTPGFSVKRMMAQAGHALRRLLTEPLVYGFDQGPCLSLTPDLRGGKGHGLSELSRLKQPIPPGATILTTVSRDFLEKGKLPRGLAADLIRSIAHIERKTGLAFCDNDRPLLVSVRSGAPVSMPGMMDTVLNVGLSRSSINALSRRADERFAWDSYRRFLMMFGTTVLGIERGRFEIGMSAWRSMCRVESDCELSAKVLMRICCDFEKLIELETGRSIPADPYEQLAMSVMAVLGSWDSERACAYREDQGIPDDLGTAVNIQAMVFGNKGRQSGTGVVFSANPATGEDGLYGEFLANAQGEDVVAGVRTPVGIAEMADAMPEVYRELAERVVLLQDHYRDMLDIEFTVEDGVLYILQVRKAKRSLEASCNFAVSQVRKGRWIEEDSIASVGIDQIEQNLSRTYFNVEAFDKAKEAGYIEGLAASPGAVSGRLYFSKERAIAAAERGESVILARPDTSPDDLPAMLRSRAVITACGGTTCHAAVVARGLNIPAVVGCKFTINEGTLPKRLEFGEGVAVSFHEGARVSVDGGRGLIVAGELPTESESKSQALETLIEWLDSTTLNLKFRKINFDHAKTQWNMNRCLNDFYLLSAIVAQSTGHSLCTAARKQLYEYQEILSEVITCYLTIAVYTELWHVRESKLLSAPAQELLSMGELFSADDSETAKAERLAGKSREYQVRFFQLAAEVFSVRGWSTGFGGKLWSLIAAAPGDFLAGRTPASIYIDHVFDMRHSAGILFNKHQMCTDQTDDYVIKRQLDVKKTVSGVDDLFDELTKLANDVSPEVIDLYDQGAQAGLWRVRNGLSVSFVHRLLAA